jgi:hypothetical protein
MAEETKAPSRPRSVGRSLIAWLLILGLLGVVLWLVSERNSRRWSLVPEDGKLVVKKGLLFPAGRSDFKAGDPATAEAYAPLRPPPGVTLPREQAFDDRLGLDQGIYQVLRGWADDEISSEDPQRLERGVALLARAERLRGLSETQRDDLRRLRGESGFYEARGLLERGAEDLRLAREKLRLAADSPTRHAAEAAVLLRQLEPLVEQAFSTSRAAASPAAPRAADAVVPATAVESSGQPR